MPQMTPWPTGMTLCMWGQAVPGAQLWGLPKLLKPSLLSISHRPDPKDYGHWDPPYPHGSQEPLAGGNLTATRRDEGVGLDEPGLVAHTVSCHRSSGCRRQLWPSCRTLPSAWMPSSTV